MTSPLSSDWLMDGGAHSRDIVDGGLVTLPNAQPSSWTGTGGMMDDANIVDGDDDDDDDDGAGVWDEHWSEKHEIGNPPIMQPVTQPTSEWQSAVPNTAYCIPSQPVNNWSQQGQHQIQHHQHQHQHHHHVPQEYHHDASMYIAPQAGGGGFKPQLETWTTHPHVHTDPRNPVIPEVSKTKKQPAVQTGPKAQSCLPCRKLKVKCEQQRPCTRCRQFNRVCLDRDPAEVEQAKQRRKRPRKMDQPLPPLDPEVNSQPVLAATAVNNPNVFDQHGSALLAIVAKAGLRDWILRTDLQYRQDAVARQNADASNAASVSAAMKRHIELQLLWAVNVHMLLLYLSDWLTASEFQLFLVSGLSPADVASPDFTQSVLGPWMQLATRPLYYVWKPAAGTEGADVTMGGGETGSGSASSSSSTAAVEHERATVGNSSSGTTTEPFVDEDYRYIVLGSPLGPSDDSAGTDPTSSSSSYAAEQPSSSSSSTGVDTPMTATDSSSSSKWSNNIQEAIQACSLFLSPVPQLRTHFLPQAVEAVQAWSTSIQANLAFQATLQRTKKRRGGGNEPTPPAMHQSQGGPIQTPNHEFDGEALAEAEAANVADQLRAAFQCLQVHSTLHPMNEDGTPVALLEKMEELAAAGKLGFGEEIHAKWCPRSYDDPAAPTTAAAATAASRRTGTSGGAGGASLQSGFFTKRCVCSCSTPMPMQLLVNPAFTAQFGWTQSDVDAAVKQHGFKFFRAWFDTREAWEEFCSRNCEAWLRKMHTAHDAITGTTFQCKFAEICTPFQCTITNKYGQYVRCVQSKFILRHASSLGGYVQTWTPI